MPFAKGQSKPANSGRKKRQLEIVYWPITRLKPYERNPRKNDQAVDRMVASVKEFGFTVPVLARSSGEVVDGHLRLKAAAKLKLQTLPVILCDSWSEAQVKAFRLLVNRSVGWADWDLEALAQEFAELQEMKFDLTMTGFDTKEIDQFTLTANPAEDDVPPVPETPTSRTGDLWLLGGHRLLCGDATSAEDVARLMAGRKADMVFTDPPYGIGYLPESDLKKLGKLKNDNREGRWDKFAEFGEFMFAAMGSMLSAMNDGACFYVCMGWEHTASVIRGVTDRGSRPYSVIVWDRMTPRMTSFPQDYIPVNEFIIYGWKRGANRQRPSAGEQQTTIWRFKTEKAADMQHTTQKPVALVRNALFNSSASGEMVSDMFGGSGTTLIACELTNRFAFLMELDLAYTDVIVTRWQNLTSKSATLEGDGRTFAEIKTERVPEVAAA